MSYEIIQKIKIENEKVLLYSSSNNVFPKDWHWWECVSLSTILKNKGQEELDLEIMKAFEEGEFQSSLNLRYTKALKILKYLFKDEYSLYDWRNNNYKYDTQEYLAYEERRKSQTFNDLLLKALNTKLPKEKFIIYDNEKDGYIKRVGSRYISFTREQNNAKQFDFKGQAEEVMRHLKNAEIRTI